jgi:hypothetical protein
MTDDDLLIPKPATPNPGLKDVVLDRSLRWMRRKRRVRTLARVGVCLACFAAGVATTFARPVPQSVTEVALVPAVPPKVADPPAPPRPLTPAELELKAEQTLVKADAARRFREAGDLYLREYADYRAALRCYRNFLDEADPADLAASPDDTWLLTSLKRAREQENTQ